MTPTWAVVLVGVVGGVLASLLTTTLTISHERASAIRPRMLDAADEFSTGTVAALQQARITAGEIKKDTSPIVDANGWFIPDIKSYLDAANNAVDDVLGKQVRVHSFSVISLPGHLRRGCHRAPPGHRIGARASAGLDPRPR